MLAYMLTFTMYRKVSFYTTADGKCPAAEFIDSQPAKVAQKIEKVPKSYFKKLSDTVFRKRHKKHQNLKLKFAKQE